MRTSKSLLAIVALSTGLVAGGALLAPAVAQNADAPATTSSKRLTIGEVHDKLVAQGYRDIDEIEREDRHFEVKAVDAEGRRVKLDVDATTGKVLDARTKSDKGDKRDRADRDTAPRAMQ